MQLALVMLFAPVFWSDGDVDVAARAFSLALFMHFSRYKIQSNAKQSHKLDDFLTSTK